MSNTGDLFGLALKLREQGYDVAGRVRRNQSRQNFDGMLKKVDKFEDWVDDQTIIVFDSTGGGKLADRLRSKGHFVVGGSAFADQIEFDRGFAFALLEEVGVLVPESHTFFDWD